jgi:hypothetical protein
MSRHDSLLPLLQHHAERAMRGAEYNALANCHCEGVDSIVLHDEPGNRVRMFFADRRHALHRNRYDVFSIAVHSHHCELRLVGLFGRAWNDVYALTPHANGPFSEMVYASGVTGESSLTPTGAHAFAHRIRSEELGVVAMQAPELHTIYVPEGARAAWLVIEGAEDEHYAPRCWTNDARPFDPSGLYERMSPAAVAGRLNTVIEMMECPNA